MIEAIDNALSLLVARYAPLRKIVEEGRAHYNEEVA